MSGRWISYDHAYEQFAAAIAAGGGDVAGTESFIVTLLEAGKLKARAERHCAMAPNLANVTRHNIDIPTSFWAAWRLTHPNFKNGGPDFGWAGFVPDGSIGAGRHRQVVSGLMIERYGVDDFARSISPGVPHCDRLPTSLSLPKPPKPLSGNRPGVRPKADWPAIASGVIASFQPTKSPATAPKVKLIADRIRAELASAGNAAYISDITITNRAKEIRKELLKANGPN